MPSTVTEKPELEVFFADAIEHHYDTSPTRRFVIEESAARMMLKGFGTDKVHHTFWWPTDIGKKTIFNSIWMAGDMIKAAFYGCAGISGGKTTATFRDRTAADVRSAERHYQLISGIVPLNLPIFFEGMRELDTHSEDWQEGVGWVKKWENADYQTDQFRIQTHGGIDLTDSWVQRLVESTASEPWLQEHAAQVTERFQGIFEAEKALGVLASLNS